MGRWGLWPLLAFLLLAACGRNEVQEPDVRMHQEHDYRPTLDLQVEVSGRQATVTVITDMIISKDHYGQARKEGEGHIHMYLDDGEKTVALQKTTVFKDLDPGTHMLKVSLHNNDHTPYGVTKSYTFKID